MKNDFVKRATFTFIIPFLILLSGVVLSSVFYNKSEYAKIGERIPVTITDREIKIGTGKSKIECVFYSGNSEYGKCYFSDTNLLEIGKTYYVYKERIENYSLEEMSYNAGISISFFYSTIPILGIYALIYTKRRKP